MIRAVKPYLPALLVALFCGFAVATFAVWAHDDTPAKYAPISVRELRLAGDEPFRAGSEVTLYNGICNKSKDTLQVVTIVGFEEQGVDRLAARNITVYPARAELGGTPLPRPIEPGCHREAPITGALPATLPPGSWKLYVNMTVMGPQSGQVQRLVETSQEFEVVP